MSIFRRIGEGAQSLLGGFGKAIISRVQDVGQSVSDAIGAIRQTGAEPDVLTVAKEWYEEYQFKDRMPSFAKLEPTLEIPRSLYTEREVKYGGKFVYTVNIYGRDLATGRFDSVERDIWTSREATPEEILDYAKANLNQDGISEQFAFINAQLLGASIRAGDYFD